MHHLVMAPIRAFRQSRTVSTTFSTMPLAFDAGGEVTAARHHRNRGPVGDVPADSSTVAAIWSAGGAPGG
jgi:hypothetical protein